jgi:hypothetical protein
MSDTEHEKPLRLTEDALGKLSEGDKTAADKFLNAAKKLARKIHQG